MGTFIVSSGLINFFSVIVGAIVAFLGSAYANHLNKVKESQFLKRDKLDEMVITVFEIQPWLESISRNCFFNEEGPIGTLSPTSKVIAFSNLYFPEFEEEVLELRKAVHSYHILLLEARTEALKSNYTILPQDYIDKSIPLWGELSNAIDNLVEKAGQKMKKLT